MLDFVAYIESYLTENSNNIITLKKKHGTKPERNWTNNTEKSALSDASQKPCL